MLLQRVQGDPTAMTARQALELATIGGAAVLGRDDIGALAPNMAADVIAFDLNAPTYAGGAVHDPVAAVIFCQPQNVDLAIVNGRVLVEGGHLRRLDLSQLVHVHNAATRSLFGARRSGLGVAMTDADLQVILTHEHTDFDALASMLGASLLYPDALPVLPHRLNRNVRSFVALYRNRLPFVTDRDLPRTRVARAFLVDTRAANWVRGMDSTTEHFIIDHHQVDAGVSPPHQLWVEAVGANTTMLVERLIESDTALSPLQATLLALGIHEDTGSLTYPSTTHRDARALAWLLEPRHNVSLEVVNRFLSHPLSTAQRALLQTLHEHSEFVEVNGHTIVIAGAEAVDFNDELSSLASRLRDYHETDAIFMVIDLGDVIQVVARSTTDEVDVGKVAKALGGGGHARAAAAPIRNRGEGVNGIRDHIIALLREYSRAAVTVHQIMSTGRPQILSPDMTVETAAELMRRYGHEGFPVVRSLPDGSDEMLGVLTRREADRALNHNLGDQPVSRFMRSGSVSIAPDASIPVLRRLIVESNWGQIPVVDTNGHILGIVTRTDLINLWDEAALPHRHAPEIAQKLQTSLSPLQHALLGLVGAEVDALDFTVYVVGGFVRDLLLNGRRLDVTSVDMDIVIEGDAIAFANRMQGLYGGRVVPHRRFNTAKWLLDDPGAPIDVAGLHAKLGVNDQDGDLPTHLDFVSARTEFYTAPTVLPTVEDSSIKLDLHRRDFSINTLALCLNPDRWGELLDFYGGANDLNQGIIRVLHSLSFLDDPTRILRAVRYEQRFGFTIEPRTLELLHDALELLDRVTPARVRHELERILQEEVPERPLARLDELGVLGRIHPHLVADDWVVAAIQRIRLARATATQQSPLCTHPSELLYWGAIVFRLPAQTHAELSERLGLRSETQRLMRSLAHLHAYLSDLCVADLPPSRVVKLLDPLEPLAHALTPLLVPEQRLVIDYIARYQSLWRHISPDLQGNDLADLGVPRGPTYGAILSALRAAKLDGHVRTRSDEEAFVRAYFRDD